MITDRSILKTDAGRGDDTLSGGGEDDSVHGGDGDDWLADVFGLVTDGTVDRIIDFEDRVDRIHLAGQSFAGQTRSTSPRGKCGSRWPARS